MSIRRFLILAFLAWPMAAIGTKGTLAQDLPVRFEGFEEYVSRMMADWKVPGAAVAVVKDGQLYYARGFGYRDVKARKPVTDETLFPIGSCTKSFTAACIALLADEGKLDWDRPVRDYMPDFRLYDDDATHALRPRDLLSHRSGLPNHDLVWRSTSLSRAEIFERLRFLQPTRHVYDEYQYNNLMYMAAGVLVHRLSGKTWEEFLREKIMNPIGMKTAALTYPEFFKSPNYSLSYREEKGEMVEAGFNNYVDVMGPGGGMKVSVAEMAKWLLLQLNKGRLGNQAVVSEKNLLMTRIPQTVVSPPDRRYAEFGYATYGMGWTINTYRGHLILTHGGALEGYRNTMSLFPDDDFGIMVLTNTDSAGYFFTRAISFFLADRLLQAQPVDWNTRFKTEQAEQKAKETKDAADNLAKRQAETHPSHPIAQLAGTYEHPAYGTLVLRDEKDSLQGAFHGRTFGLEHYHYDIFEGSGLFQGVKIAFVTGPEGKVERAVASIPNAGEIVFARK